MVDQTMREQLQKWHEDGEYEAIIKEIRGLPAELLDGELKGQLGRALNNAEAYGEALAVLDSVDEEERGALWHFRRGYALFGLERYAAAREDFARGVELDPEDSDGLEFFDMCSARLALPALTKTYSQRVTEFWESFAAREEELRVRMDHKEDLQPAVELVSQLFDAVFTESFFEIGHNGEKYELILSPEGQKQRLFRLEYWREQAPRELLERWCFQVGRPACPEPEKFHLQIYGIDICADEVMVWLEELEDKTVGLNVYSEKWKSLMEEDANRVYSLMSILIDQCIGEISAIKNVGYLEILKEPDFHPGEAADPEKFSGPILLCRLRDFIAGLQDDAEKAEGLDDLCRLYTAYQMDPEARDKEDWFLRKDVFIGNTCCVPVVNEYYNGRTEIADENVKDGVVFGFLYYNNDKVPQKEMVPFRGAMEDEIAELAGGSGRILGGATGLIYSYIDCVCYDLSAFLDAAVEVMNKRELDEIVFHVFRRDCGGVNLKVGAEEETVEEQGCDCGEDADIEEDDEITGHFQGFVLLNTAEIDMDGIVKRLEEEWGIQAEDGHDHAHEDNCGCGHDDGCGHDHGDGCGCGEDDGTTRVFSVGRCLVAISLIRMAIPDEEAEHFAQTNYMWPEAVEVTKTHCAHILVAVMPNGVSAVEAGKLYSKVVSACLKQDNAIGVYTSGTVYQPEFYIEVSDMMKEDEDELPVLAWVYFGLYRTDKGNSGYTYGLTAFGRDEIEILNSGRSPEELRDFLYQVTSYLIACDVTLKDGETIGFSEDERLSITRSRSAVMEGDSLKIEY